MTKVASRLKDTLWSLRRRFGMENDLDRFFACIVFERELTEDQFENLFVSYPKRVPANFISTLLAQVCNTVRVYRKYCLTRKGYHRVIKGIVFLENVVRVGALGCVVVPDSVTGYRLELKSK